MKRFSILQMALIAALVVVAASCGMTRSAYNEYDDPDAGTYYSSPYYGNTPVIIQRDLYTGRYYQVEPYGAYAYPAAPYRSNRYYRNYNNNQYSDRNNNQNYNNRNTNYYRGNNYSNQKPQTQTQMQQDQKRNSAKEEILGPKKSGQ